jgi:SAM-dependent methyltransferase
MDDNSTHKEDLAMNQTVIHELDLDELRTSIREEYSVVANEPQRGFHFHTGRKLAAILGYKEEWLDILPAEAVESMAGTGNPFNLGELKPGEHVVDCGSGAGADSLIAAQMVAPGGRVIGVDMTPEMVAKARNNAIRAGMANVEFREGYLESLPVPDAWADVVISNGVLNLVPDKEAALSEMYRILKPGGRIQIADIALQKPVPEGAKRDVTLWTGCIAGGLLKMQLERKVMVAGFKEVEVLWGKDVFSGAPQHSDAAKFGTLGVTVRARKG